MATKSWATPIENSSDATFRTWGLEISNAFTELGFPKNSDSGQINWATATRPSASTAAGYEIRYLNDSLHATAPIYVKIEYGSATTQSLPQLWISTGTGTNGSGTLTGTTTTRTSINTSSTYQINANFNPWVSKMCVLPGYVALLFKIFSTVTGGIFGLVISRFLDDSGNISQNGWCIYYTSGGNSAFTRTSTIRGGSTTTDTTSAVLIVGGDTSSLINSAPQLFKHYTRAPNAAPTVLDRVVSFIYTDIGNLALFSANIAGTTRTYLAINSRDAASWSLLCHPSPISSARLAILWE